MLAQVIPQGRIRIEKFSVSEQEAKAGAAYAARVLGPDGRHVPPGTYRRLMRGLVVMMTDTPEELQDLEEYKSRVTGDVLINGLGLGIAVQMALDKPDVSSVTVIEHNPDVIRLVSSGFSDPRLKIIEGDALTWMPPDDAHWDVVWHDIWDNITGDNVPQMRRLHRRYKKHAVWQDSWCRRQCEKAYRLWMSL